MRRGGACFARLCILKAVGGSETYVNLSDPFRILILKSSPRRDETLKLSQVQCLKASLKRFTHLLLLENITRMSNASSSTLLTCANTILLVCQLLYTTRIYRSKEKILHDIIWYCMILYAHSVSISCGRNSSCKRKSGATGKWRTIESRTSNIILPCSGTHEWRAGLLRYDFAAIQRSLHLWLKDKAHMMMSNDQRWMIKDRSMIDDRGPIHDPWEEEEHVLLDFASSKQWGGVKHTLTCQIHFES